MVLRSLAFPDFLASPAGLVGLADPVGDIFDKLALVSVKAVAVPDSTTSPHLTPKDSLDEGLAGSILDAPEEPFGPANFGDFPVEAQLETVSSHDGLIVSGGLTLALSIALREEIVFRLLGVDDVEFVVASGGIDVSASFESWRFTKASVQTGLALRVSRSCLVPVRRVAGADSEVTFEPDAALPAVTLGLVSPVISVDADGAVDIVTDEGLSLLGPVMIGNTGVILEDVELVVALGRGGERPSGAPAGWRGLLIRKATLRIPNAFAGSVVVTDFGIGTGGVTGDLNATFDLSYHPVSRTFSGPLAGTVLGFPGGVHSLDVSLRQSVPTLVAVSGRITLPFFSPTSAPLSMRLSLGSSGTISASLASDLGAVTLVQDGVLSIAVTSLSVNASGATAAVILDGSVTPLFGGFDWPTFVVNGLRVDSTGSISVAGGWLDVARQGVIDIGGAMLEIAKIGFGSEENGTKWIGFSGGLKLAEPLPMSGSVEGLRIHWKGNDVWMSLTGASVGFEISDTVRFAGKLALVEEPPGPLVPGAPKTRGFRGSGSLTIIPTNLKVDAELIIGKTSGPLAYSHGYLFVDIQTPVGMPTPVPNVAIYGLNLLTTLSMEPAKEPDDPWWEGWYLLPQPGVTSTEKWRPSRGAFAVGAGVTLGTAADNGYAVHARLLLGIAVPGPIVMLEGVAGFLEDRSLLGDGSPVRAFALFDGATGQFTMNAQARYPYSDGDSKAKLIKASGGAEAFFGGDGAWHFYLGEREPKEKRVLAELFSLFEARSYLMLEPDTASLGIWVGYERKWKKGPLKVSLDAWMDANAQVSWRPTQFKGDLTLVGGVGLKAYGVGASLGVRAEVSAQGPRPYRVHAEIEAKLKTPKFLPDPKFRFEWNYREDSEPAFVDPIGRIGVEHLKVTETWPLDGAESPETAPVVPLDAKLSVAFERNVDDAIGIATNGSGVPPWERSGSYEFSYRLTEVRLERRPKAGGAWETVALRTTNADGAVNQDLLWGVWLAVEAAASSTDVSDGSPATKLLLHAKSPFEYGRATADDSVWDHFSEWHPDFGWLRVHPVQPRCVDFKKWAKDRTQRTWLRTKDVVIHGENLHVEAANARIELIVGVHTEHPAWVVFPEPVCWIQITGRPAGNGPFGAQGFDGRTAVGEPIAIDQETTVIGVIGGSDVTILRLDGNGALSEICFVTSKDAERFQEEKERAGDTLQTPSHYADPTGSELFMPQSEYRLTIKAEARRRKTGEEEFETQSAQRTRYFQTADPPGVFDEPSSETLTTEQGRSLYPTAGALRDLDGYVGRISEGGREVANVVPRHGSLAVYRSYDVGLELNEDYAEEMYLRAGMPLAIALYDANGVRAASLALGSTPPPPAVTQWSVGNAAPTAAFEQQVASSSVAVELARDVLVAPDEINPFEGGILVQPALQPDVAPRLPSLWAGGPLFVLSPRTQYRAVVEAVRPGAVIPLDDQGRPMIEDGAPAVRRVASNGSNLKSLLQEKPAGVETAKLVTNGRDVMVHVPKGAQNVPMMAADETLFALQLAGVGLGTPPRAPAVYAWNFVTSSFASFVHHVHSFYDVPWELRMTGADLTEVERADLRASVQAAAPSESAILTAARVPTSGPLPESLDISILRDGAHRYALVLESPEPIDWRRQGQDGQGRTSVTVCRNAMAAAGTTASLGPVKISDGALGDDGWVEIFAREATDLSRWKIDLLDDAGAATPFHIFSDGTHVAPGSVLRVHAAALPQLAPNAELAVVAASTPLQLPVDGTTLRLTNAAGVEVHRRQLVSGEFDVVYETVVAADVDGTRTALFLKRNNAWIEELPAGTYRIDLTFRRVAPGDGRPTLRRNSSTQDETVALYVAVA